MQAAPAVTGSIAPMSQTLHQCFLVAEVKNVVGMSCSLVVQVAAGQAQAAVDTMGNYTSACIAYGWLPEQFVDGLDAVRPLHLTSSKYCSSKL
jgi:hypothetical protein